MQKYSIEGQVAVVTGGNAGIGKAIALKLVQEGVKVAIFGTNAETGRLTIEEITAQTGKNLTKFFVVDVSKTDLVEAAFKQVVEELGEIDILVNNAGITSDQLLMKMSESDWDQVLDINLKSCYNTCKQVIRSMMKARKGRIINITSVVGLVGNPGQTNYAASKAGMIGFSKSLAKEVASRGILVNCVAPGFIRTKMTDKLSELQIESVMKQIPLGSLGDPEDIANMVWFLSCPLSKYITGQVFAIDGGMVM